MMKGLCWFHRLFWFLFFASRTSHHHRLTVSSRALVKQNHVDHEFIMNRVTSRCLKSSEWSEWTIESKIYRRVPWPAAGHTSARGASILYLTTITLLLRAQLLLFILTRLFYPSQPNKKRVFISLLSRSCWSWLYLKRYNLYKTFRVKFVKRGVWIGIGGLAPRNNTRTTTRGV